MMATMLIDGYCTPGTERDTVLSISELLRQMDDAGIEKAIVAPEDRELSVANADGNERILQAAAQHSDRLVPACGVNPWYGPQAIAELERSADRGARLLVIAPALQGFIPTDDLADELLTHASALRMPIYMHTGPHSSGGPTQVVLVAEKHSNANFILGHCGSTDHSWDMVTILEQHRLENLWFELSFVRPWVVPRYVGSGGSSRFIWGSGSPRNAAKFELSQLEPYLPRAQYPDIYGSNLADLIQLSASTT